MSEIEPVVNDLVKMTEMCFEKDKEIERLNNIIKEVREYIEKNIAMFKNGDILVDMNINELLEILDKEGSE